MNSNIVKKVLFLCFIVLIIASKILPVHALPIDLTKVDWYIKHGFDESWTKKLPIADNNWIKVPSNEKRSHFIKIRDYNFSGIPKHSFLSNKTFPIESFILITSFELENTTKIRQPIGLLLRIIDDNWAVYLNGTLLKKEIALKNSSTLLKHSQQLNLKVILPDSILKSGENILAFHIIGDPTKKRLGLYYKGPYLIDYYVSLTNHKKIFFSILSIGIFIFIFIYYLAIYLKRPQKEDNLYLAAFSGCLALYLFTRSEFFKYFIHNGILQQRIEYIAVFFLIPVMLNFSELMFTTRKTIASKITLIIASFLSVLTCVTNTQFSSDLLKIHNLLVMIPIFYAGIFLPNYGLIKTFKETYSKTIHPLVHIYKTLIHTTIGNLYLSFLVLTSAGIFDFFDSLIIGTGIKLCAIGFLCVLVTMTIVMSNKFLKVHARMEELNQGLEKEVNRQTIILRKKNDELVMAKETAERANEFKSKFLANVTHDLRTPLHVILGSLNLMKDNDIIRTVPDLIKSVDISKSSAENQLKLVNDLLDLGKIEQGKMEMDIESFKIEELFIGIEETMATLIKEKPVKFILNNQVDIPYLKSDKRRLVQVILNLLGNAAKFTEEGSISLTVSIATQEKQLIFSVSDTGIGLSPEGAARIFEAYAMENNETQRKVKGTGLGLSICKEFIELFGGKIWVESEKGKGTSFIFWIPLIEETETDLKKDEKEEAYEIDYDLLQTKRILICDDDSFNRDYLDLLLKGIISYDQVDSGQHALDILEDHMYDLIFMDINMPKMNGIEALQHIRNRDIKIPVVALTAETGNVVEDLKKEGFDGYFEKPFKSEILLTYLTQHFRSDSDVS